MFKIPVRPLRRLIVLPWDVLISTDRPASEVNVFRGTVRETTRLAGAFLAQVDVGGRLIAAELPKTPFESNRLRPGSEVFVELRLTKLRTGS